MMSAAAAHAQRYAGLDMDGKYEIGRDHIRALAIECHALDVQFDRLFNAPTICGASDRVYRA